MSKKPDNKKVSTGNNPTKSTPDHDKIEMIKYGITRETKYSYLYRNYKYDSLEHAVAEAKRSKPSHNS